MTVFVFSVTWEIFMLIRIFFLVTFTLFSCQVSGIEIDQSELSYKDGLFLRKSTGDPFTGVVKELYDNGQIKLERHFQNGVEHGLHRSWFENEQLEYQGNRKDGQLDGEIRGLYEDGSPRFESNYIEGQQVDVSRHWHRNGQLQREAHYIDGHEEGISRGWYDNGQLASEGKFVQGKLEGTHRRWTRDGQIWLEESYHLGNANGVQKSWHDNGQLKCEFFYENGIQTGRSRCWHENGKLHMEANFKDDDFDGLARSWNKRGKLTDESCFRKNKKIDMGYCRTGQVPSEFEDTEGLEQAKSEDDNAYQGENKVLLVRIPQSNNWAGVPYIAKALDNRGDKHYDKVMFSVDDFGEYLVAGARFLPDDAIARMDQDEPKAQLRAISEAALFGWRSDLEDLPGVVEESFFDSKHGYTLRRLYLAENGSLIANVCFDKGKAEAERFDTYIVSLVSRKENVLVYAFAENDQSPKNPQQLIDNALTFYNGIVVLPISE
jgi:antitoxin component YwqK of YwqJK toxin-antitoxin module